MGIMVCGLILRIVETRPELCRPCWAGTIIEAARLSGG